MSSPDGERSCSCGNESITTCMSVNYANLEDLWRGHCFLVFFKSNTPSRTELW
jgi:hypothetical protein